MELSEQFHQSAVLAPLNLIPSAVNISLYFLVYYNEHTCVQKKTELFK